MAENPPGGLSPPAGSEAVPDSFGEIDASQPAELPTAGPSRATLEFEDPEAIREPTPEATSQRSLRKDRKQTDRLKGEFGTLYDAGSKAERNRVKEAAKRAADKQAAADQTAAGKEARMSPKKIAAKNEKARIAALEEQAALRDATRAAQKRDKEEKKAKAKEAKEAKEAEEAADGMSGSPLLPRLDKLALQREAAKKKAAEAEAAGKGKDAMSPFLLS